MTRAEIAEKDRSGGGMFAVIPSVVMRDQSLSMSAKMLYGIITWRCNDRSFCWATNRALGDELGLSAKRVSSLLSALELGGHIETELIRDEETGQILRRHIYPVVKSARELPDPPPDLGDTPIPKNEDTPPQTRCEGIPENGEEKYKEEIKNINTPYSPPQADKPSVRRGKRQEPKQAPDWKPERFEGFWRAYPVKKSKQAAIRAWDRLRPDDGLLLLMGRALQRQMNSRMWREGYGIPYPATWLNQHRWEDEEDQPLPPPDGPAPSLTPERFGWD